MTRRARGSMDLSEADCCSDDSVIRLQLNVFDSTLSDTFACSLICWSAASPRLLVLLECPTPNLAHAFATTLVRLVLYARPLFHTRDR
jgi:hypothetical protein